MLASKLQRKALSVGLPAPGDAPALPALVAELSRRLAGGDGGADTPLGDDAEAVAMVGDVLFAVADLARRGGIDPEQALRQRATVLRDAIVTAEAAAGA